MRVPGSEPPMTEPPGCAAVSRFDAASVDADLVIAALRRDGACIVENVLSGTEVDQINDEVRPWIERSGSGQDDFTGRSTRRTGALAARSAACRDAIVHPLVTATAEGFLAPWTNRIQLHLTQTIAIGPGQGRQPLHRDRLAWGGYIPREVEPQCNTIWALTDFTADNGATSVAPGSPGWDDDRRPAAADIAQATMPRGSVLFYTGSVIHGGGENRTEDVRIGMNITYCLAWLRTEENNYLSCPPDVARDFEPELQELLGYTMGNYALGYYSSPDGTYPSGLTMSTDLAPPESALGRKPRESHSAGLTGE